METKRAAAIFEVLASDIRLEVFRLLVRSAPQGLVAGEVAKSLSIPASNLSFHLKALANADLVSVAKEGRFLRYRADVPLMLELVGFLTEECCQEDPQKCLKFREASGVPLGVFNHRRVW